MFKANRNSFMSFVLLISVMFISSCSNNSNINAIKEKIVEDFIKQKIVEETRNYNYLPDEIKDTSSYSAIIKKYYGYRYGVPDITNLIKKEIIEYTVDGFINNHFYIIGNDTLKVEYVYNKDNLISEEKWFYYFNFKSTNNLTVHNRYTYDSNKNLIVFQNILNISILPGPIDKKIANNPYYVPLKYIYYPSFINERREFYSSQINYKYDNNQIIEVTKYDKDGKNINKYGFTYEAGNLKSFEMNTNESGKLLTYKIIVNDNRSISEYRSTYSDDEFITSLDRNKLITISKLSKAVLREYTLDKNGNIIKSLNNDKKHIVEKYFNENNQITKEVFKYSNTNSDTVAISSRSYKYENGKLVSALEYDAINEPKSIVMIQYINKQL